jgi:chromosome segregation and condensation protein ScpB
MNRVIRLADFAAEAEAMPEMHTQFFSHVDAEHLRMVEALLFAAAEPLDEQALAQALPKGADVVALLGELQQIYAKRGVNLVQVNGRWQFRTASDLAFLLRKEQPEQRRLSRDHRLSPAGYPRRD